MGWVDGDGVSDFSGSAKAVATAIGRGGVCESRGSEGALVEFELVAKNSETDVFVEYEVSSNGSDWYRVTMTDAGVLTAGEMVRSVYPLLDKFVLSGYSNGDKVSVWVPFVANFFRVGMKGTVGGSTWRTRVSI